jgi:hypothetical protein
VSGAKVFSLEDLMSIFHLPLSRQAHEEMLQLQQIMMDVPLSDCDDVWKFCWGDSYTSAKFYSHIHSHISVPLVFKWIWKSSCTMKAKNLAWLLLRDRLNTRDLLQRRQWKVTNDKHCVMCPLKAYEDRVHLFFECNFSTQID